MAERQTVPSLNSPMVGIFISLYNPMVGTEGFGGLLADSNVSNKTELLGGMPRWVAGWQFYYCSCDPSSVTLSQADDIKPFPCETSGWCLVELSRRNSKSAMARVGGCS